MSFTVKFIKSNTVSLTCTVELYEFTVRCQFTRLSNHYRASLVRKLNTATDVVVIALVIVAVTNISTLIITTAVNIAANKKH